MKNDDAMADAITDVFENNAVEDSAKILAQNIHAPWKINTIKNPIIGYCFSLISLLL